MKLNFNNGILNNIETKSLQIFNTICKIKWISLKIFAYDLL